MSPILKAIIGITVLALIIAGAAFTYNLLSKDVTPPDLARLTESQGDASGTANLQKAPDFTMVDRDGNEVKLSAMMGKPLVLSFWASWCPPCRAEMPEFGKVAAELGGEVQFIMLNLTDGQRETIETATKYVDDRGFSLPLYFDTMQEGVYQYNVQSIPVTLFINKHGYIVTTARGEIDEETLRKGIDLCRQ